VLVRRDWVLILLRAFNMLRPAAAPDSMPASAR
jgi:hypothetical protein